jgi:alkyl hydroperoxide reductase subunit AhpC
MQAKPKSKICFVSAICSYLIFATTPQVSPVGAQKNPLVNKEAPKLEVAEWVKGQPVTLEKLKEKIVLLYFWSAPNTVSLEKFPALIRFHRKYARDGLAIIAIHDSSLDKESLLKESSKTINLSDIDFRMAIDSPVTGQIQNKGKTIAAYGVTTFPAHVLIGKDGKIQSFGEDLMEKRINLLLYGHTRNINNEPPPLQDDDVLSKARKEFITIAIGAMVLILVGAFVVVKRRLGNF